VNSLFSERGTTHRCLRCDHTWTGRESFNGSAERPKRCARCRSPLWNVPRKRARIRLEPLECLERWQALGLFISLHLGRGVTLRAEADAIVALVHGETVRECVISALPHVQRWER
jgi:hypothetical protein